MKTMRAEFSKHLGRFPVYLGLNSALEETPRESLLYGVFNIEIIRLSSFDTKARERDETVWRYRSWPKPSPAQVVQLGVITLLWCSRRQ